MNENTYRLTKTVLLAMFVIGFLAIGWRVSSTGRYVQFDRQKTYSPDGTSRLANPPNYVIDSWTGERLPTE